MSAIRSGSVIRTDTGAYWYCCGDWRLQGIEDAYPAILAYTPREDVSIDSEKFKTLLIEGRTFIKVYGQPIEVYRELLRSTQGDVYLPSALGKVAFVRQSRITEMKDPVAFASVFLQAMPRERSAFQSMAELLRIPVEAIGVSGSTLVLSLPERRHEIDIVFYGRAASRRIFRVIERNRNDVVFLRASMPPFHLPFHHQGVWLDPQFSEGERERHFLDGASMRVLRQPPGITLGITDVRDGIFFPSVYGTNRRHRLISFRPGHRGFFHRGDRAHFPLLSLVRFTYASGRVETAYGILNDEWGEKR